MQHPEVFGIAPKTKQEHCWSDQRPCAASLRRKVQDGMLA